MTELKTLKDFQERNSDWNNEWVDARELRAEAVKWVKEVSNCHDRYGFNWSDEIEGFIKYFFNLTEEEESNEKRD